MPLSTTVGGVAALLAAGGYLLRRRISRKWISPSSIPPSARRFAPDETIVITGGNAGLGYEAARELARRCAAVGAGSEGGCRIVLACRDVDAGNSAAERIRTDSGNDDVECLKLDLSSLDSVREFSRVMKDRDEKVCALICNAGVWMPEGGRKTRDGFELHFGVNHLGHFALIKSLLPRMKESDDGRIVIVGSSLCRSGKIDLDKRDFVRDGRVSGREKKKSFAPLGYMDSKLMNMLTARELAVRLRGSSGNITTCCVSPGFCSSQLGRNINMPFHKRLLMTPLMRFFQRSSAQGAQNVVFSIMEDKAKLVSGAMYQDGVVWEDGVKLIDTLGNDLQKGLWDLSEELIKENEAK